MTILLFATALAATVLSYTGSDWAAQVSVALLAAAGGWLASRTPAWRLPALGLAMVGAAAVGLVQIAAGATASMTATARETTLWLTMAAVFAAGAAQFAARAERHQFLQWFAAVAGLIAAFAIVQPYAARFGWVGLAAAADEMVGPFRSRNAYASFVLLAFPVAGWATKRFGPEWWLPASALLASAFMTGSRAGATLTLAEAVLLAVWMRSRTLVLALAIAAGAGLLWGGSNLTARIGYRDPMEHRRDIYASALELVSKRPLTGWGLGSFEQVYPEQARFDVGATVNHVHSDWLEAAVEGGLGYATALAGCTLLIVWRSRQSIWALGLPATVFHSLVDFPFQRIGVTIWFLLLAAAAYAHSEAGVGWKPPRTSETGSAPAARRPRAFALK